MKAIHIDISGKEHEAHEVHGDAGFISWTRLATVLRAAGELKPNEALAFYQLDNRGITYRTER